MAKEDALAHLDPSATEHQGRPWIQRADVAAALSQVYDDIGDAPAGGTPTSSASGIVVGLLLGD